MSPIARISAFAVLLAAVFAAATLAGAKVDPGVEPSDDEHQEGPEMTTTTMDPATESEHAGGSEPLPGLAVAEAGYRLVPEQTTLTRGPGARYAFRIVDEDGQAVRDFDVEHERRMHLVVVRRDFANFQHLHPRMLENGTWQAEVDLTDAGVYRAFADFSTGGESLTLAADIMVPGDFDPVPIPAPASAAAAGDGYRVTLESPAPRSGGANPAEFSVTRNGRPVGSIQPYLGADGHLVALREHDQAFLHTHPEGEPGGPEPIAFRVEYPIPGTYRLFLQFKHEGRVRTAGFTQTVASSDASEVIDDAH